MLHSKSMAQFMIDNFTEHFQVKRIGRASLVFLPAKCFTENLLIRNDTGSIPDRSEPEHPKLTDIILNPIAIVNQ
jgi:hypothetical protein